MKTRLLWDKILRMGIKLCMLTGVAFTFAACYAPAYEAEMEFEVYGEVTNEENQALKNIEVTIKHHGWPMCKKYSDEKGKYLIYEERMHYFSDSVDIIARDTSGIFEPDSVRVFVAVEPKPGPKDRWAGSFSVKQDFQLKKKE